MQEDFDYKNYEGFKYSDNSVLYDTQGKALTQALFREKITKNSYESGYRPHYTLKERTTDGLPSAYQIYINSVDEYDAAMKLVGSMKHWRKLCDLGWFLNEDTEKGFAGLYQWREDMRLRDESLAKEALLNQTKKGSVSAASSLYKNSQTSSKQSKSSNNRGRSSKEKDVYEEDLTRLQLVKGGQNG